MKQIKDFAVSSQEAGFDEFLKVYNEYFKFDFFGNAKFYGAKNGENYQTGQAWITPITPSQAIALLTNQTTDKMNTLENSCFQFQENDEASKECIRIMNERYKQQNITKEFIGYDNHFYFLESDFRYASSAMPLNKIEVSPQDYLALLTQPKQLTEDCQSKLDGVCLLPIGTCRQCTMTSHPETLPVQDTFIADHDKLSLQMANEEIAHLQQQLKEAKELLKELESYLDDEVAIVQAAVSSDNYACINDAQLPSLYLKINQFLTRNK